MRDKSSFVYVRTGPRPAGRQGVRRSAPAVRAEVLSWRVRVRMPDGSEREVEQDELETFVDPDSVENNQPESRLEKAGLREQERVTHPSFGTIRVSNSMGYRHLFGSRVDNQHVISMSISAGAVLHSNEANMVSEGRTLVELSMSPSQFVAICADSAAGRAVPCTISYIAPSPGPGQVAPVPHKRRPKSEELYERLRQMGETAARKADAAAIRLREKLAASKTPKGLQAEILAEASAIHRIITDEIPFLAQRVDEELHATAEEAGLNAEALISLALKKVGLEEVAKNPHKFMRHVGASHQIADSAADATIIDTDSEDPA